MKNRIYFFTGTGNSLKAAKEIAADLPESELVAIERGMDSIIPSGYGRIGLVFPVYYWGPPAMVVDFMKNANFAEQGDTSPISLRYPHMEAFRGSHCHT